MKLKYFFRTNKKKSKIIDLLARTKEMKKLSNLIVLPVIFNLIIALSSVDACSSKETTTTPMPSTTLTTASATGNPLQTNSIVSLSGVVEISVNARKRATFDPDIVFANLTKASIDLFLNISQASSANGSWTIVEKVSDITKYI